MASQVNLRRYEIFPRLRGLSELVHGEDRETTIGDGVIILTARFHKPENPFFVPSYINLPLHFEIRARQGTLDTPTLVEKIPVPPSRWNQIETAAELYHTLSGPFFFNMTLQGMVDRAVGLANFLWTPLAAASEVREIKEQVDQIYSTDAWSNFVGHEYWKLLTQADPIVMSDLDLSHLARRTHMSDPSSELPYAAFRNLVWSLPKQELIY
jgi:hypothetical protein